MGQEGDSLYQLGGGRVGDDVMEGESGCCSSSKLGRLQWRPAVVPSSWPSAMRGMHTTS